MSVRRPHPALSLGVSIALHLLGDYALQKLFSSFFSLKTTSLLHLLAHCFCAAVFSHVFIGLILKHTLGELCLDILLGTLSHFAVDVFRIRGGIALKLLDQSLHLALIGIVVALSPNRGGYRAQTPVPRL